MNQITLNTFHNRLIDGLLFCRKAYLLFDQIRRDNDGIESLRMRKSSTEKKLIEELLPIAKYVQLKYGLGRRIKVRWLNGNQQHDAILKQSGPLVKQGYFPTEYFLETTCAVHPNDYLAREAINNSQPVFGLDGLERKKHKKIVSNPTVRKNYDFVDSFANIIIERIKAKSDKPYPKNTALIVECNLGTPYTHDE